ncbi:hypothetical protein WCT80_20370 [Pectobacterium carotovorum]|uniref:Uncharacterized protein n=1 Tax=Pectobacterium versatile TaxID=2488639 RepID=A0AAW3RVK1_9GAMM|nr:MULTISPECIES: hypothetical protein [Pectobacterium]MBA0160294.1 hypothetical protein [Pectobacterium versatile]POE18505.1 hypothetical protein BV923_20995 [Pectobacterium odoriferum]WCG82247.1 hypothetical protein O1Q74_15150 [Pectobacterium sp. A5351]
MAKHLTKEDINYIVNVISGWDSKKSGGLTWDALCDSISSVVGKRPTRQSLNIHKNIVKAFNFKKDMIKSGKSEIRRPANLNIASQHISNLENKLKMAEEENRSIKEMFIIWQYNADIHGLSEDNLNKPLPIIDRERSY